MMGEGDRAPHRGSQCTASDAGSLPSGPAIFVGFIEPSIGPANVPSSFFRAARQQRVA